MRKLSHFVVCCMLCVVCCMLFSGCGKKEETEKIEKNEFNLETICIDDSILDDGRMNYYTWNFKHNGYKIDEKSWTRNYEYETLNEAVKEENRAKEDCKNKDYYCDVFRNNKTITYYISYDCGKTSISNTNQCNYYEEIKSLEKLGFICEETK